MSKQTDTVPDLHSSTRKNTDQHLRPRNNRSSNYPDTQPAGSDSPISQNHISLQVLTSPTINRAEPVAAPSQLNIILAKLIELDAIKTHLTNIDQHLDLLQPNPNPSTIGLVAQRS